MTSAQDISNDIEHQQVVIALMEETEKPSSETIKKNSKNRRPKKNYCTEDYLVGYGVPILIVILFIIIIILFFIYIRTYNRNCKHTKGASCRGILWYFT